MEAEPTKKKRSYGRRTRDGAYGTKMYSVMLTPDLEQALRELGGGQLSLGIREAARRLLIEAASKEMNIKDLSFYAKQIYKKRKTRREINAHIKSVEDRLSGR